MEGVFQLNTTKHYRRIRINNVLSSPAIVLLMLVMMLLAIAAWVSWWFGVGSSAWAFQLLGAAVIATSAWSFLMLLFTFGTTYLHFQSPQHTIADLVQQDGPTNNVADVAEFRLLQLLGPVIRKQTPEEMQPLVAALLQDNYVQHMVRRLELNPDAVMNAIVTHAAPYMTWDMLLHTVVSQAANRGHAYLDALDFMGVFLLHPNMQNTMRHFGLREQDISFMLWWQHVRHDMAHSESRWWDPERLLAFTGIGLSWASGFTPFVDQFMRLPGGDLWDIPFGHTSQVDQLISALARRKQSNVMVTGQPGVGRLGVVKEMARRVQTATAHPALNGQRVAYINVGELASFAGSGAGQLNVVSRALDELERAGNMIVILDGLGSVLGQAGEERSNAADVLLPFFSSPDVRVVVLASTEEYHDRLRENDELNRLFEIVQVPPLSPEKTLQLMALTVPDWERQAGVFVPYSTLREIVDNTSTILPQVPFPEKAFDILEEVVVNAESTGNTVITAEDINDLVSQKVGVNIGQIKADEGQHLLNLDEVLHRRIVNQV